MTKPRVILFDWDNTLANTWPIIYKSLEKTFILMGEKPMTLEEVMHGERGIHGSLRNSFPVIFGDKWEEARKHYFDNFLAVHLDEILPMEGAHNVLERIKDKNIEMCIVSNKTGPYLREEVNHLGWNNYFINIIGATDAEDDKPSHHPIDMALRGTQIDYNHAETHNDVWLVGDSLTDLHTADNARIVPILFGDNIQAVEHHKTQGSEHKKHIGNHQELLDIIEGL